MSRRGMGKFVLGAGLGAAIGLMFAPKNGEETRKDLKQALDDFIEKIKNTDTEEVKQTIELKIDEIKEGIANLDKETVLEEAKKTAKKLQDAASELVDYAVEKGTPVLQKSATSVKQKVIKVAKDVTKKLEETDDQKPKKDKEEK